MLRSRLLFLGVSASLVCQEGGEKKKKKRSLVNLGINYELFF